MDSDILIDKRFTKFVVNYVCFAPPPSVLPDHYPDLHYDCKFVTKKRYVVSNCAPFLPLHMCDEIFFSDLPATMNITKKGVEIIDKNKNQVSLLFSRSSMFDLYLCYHKDQGKDELCSYRQH